MTMSFLQLVRRSGLEDRSSMSRGVMGIFTEEVGDTSFIQ
jgi:hypothetical protein